MHGQRPSREEADALTHPSGNFKLPYRTAPDLAEAEPIIAEYCSRMCEWGIARFPVTSVESRFLRLMQSLSMLLALGPSVEDSAIDHWKAVLDVARRVMKLRLEVHAFSMSVEVGKVQYEVTDLVHCAHATAMAGIIGECWRK
jgi:hypothetical protein